MAMLQRYREWQQQYAEEPGDKYAMRELVFASPFGTPIRPANFTRRYFRPLLRKCGIDEKFTFHGLRHTHAALLLQQEVNPKIVQERSGHSSIKATMDTYSHVLPDMQRQAVDAMERIFE
ncbi:MAG: tyrosine-type recombinase/integrase [Selenomonadaceae bacterium]|nr:tyrosine-type recombinase/integrase [Selenomonadaceae bacterium]